MTTDQKREMVKIGNALRALHRTTRMSFYALYREALRMTAQNDWINQRPANENETTAAVNALARRL